MNIKRFAALMLALALLAFTACAKGGAGEEQTDDPADGNSPAAETDAAAESPVSGRTVAFISGDAGDPFYAAARKGAQEYAAQWGLRLVFPEETDQTAAVRRAVEAGVDGICIAPGGVETLPDQLREARAAGVAVTTWFADAPPDARMLTVSQGTADMLGPMLVEMGAESLKERGVDVMGGVRWIWHASDLTSADQNAWFEAGSAYIKNTYPQWIMAEQPYCSDGDAEYAAAVGGRIFEEYPDVQLIICSDFAALPGQCRAAHERGLTAADVTITGFCPRSVMLPYLEEGVCARWGLWDCGMQSAMACYLAAWLSQGNEARVGDVIGIPRIGSVELLANSELAAEQESGVNSGVVLLPERIVYTAKNVADYDF